jgi:hypothetical protein
MQRIPPQPLALSSLPVLVLVEREFSITNPSNSAVIPGFATTSPAHLSSTRPLKKATSAGSPLRATRSRMKEERWMRT